MCKFGTFCSYRHTETQENILKKEVANLKLEVKELNKKVKKLSDQLESFENPVENSVPAKDTDETVEEEVETPLENAVDVKENTNETVEKELEQIKLFKEKSLDEIIRENSDSEKMFRLKCERCNFKTNSDEALENHLKKEHEIFNCNICDFSAASSKGLKIHKAKKHTKVAERDGQLCSCIGKIKESSNYETECNICGFKGILTPWVRQSTDMVKHFKEKHEYISEEDCATLFKTKI